MQNPWVDKYRPRSLASVFHQDAVVDALREFMKRDSMPHLLFYGPPGVGKTTTILALCRELYGKRLFKRRVLELNASDERGIEVIRGKVKDFAHQAAPAGGRKGAPAFKFIILDEADAMTTDAQAALRRTMERFVATTRVCLVCNYPSRIIPPLVSRCARFRFAPVPAEAAAGFLAGIADAEGCGVGADTTAAVARVCDGDLRRGVNLLQALSMFAGPGARPEDVDALCGLPPPRLLDDVFAQLLAVARRGAEGESVRGEYQGIAGGIVREALPAVDVLRGLSARLLACDDVPPAAFAQVSLRFAEAERLILDGTSELLALLDAMNFAGHVLAGAVRAQ